jgi:hypothetical protein
VRSKRSNVLKRSVELARRVRAGLDVKEAILDVVALNNEGRMDFRILLSGRGWLHYAAFDLLWLNGTRSGRGRARQRALRSCPAAGPRGDRGEAKTDTYSPQTIWYKVKNPAYTQAEGRGELLMSREPRVAAGRGSRVSGLCSKELWL